MWGEYKDFKEDTKMCGKYGKYKKSMKNVRV